MEADSKHFGTSSMKIAAPWMSLALAALCLVCAGLSGVAAFAAAARGQQTAMAHHTGWASGRQHAITARVLFATKREDPPAREILEMGRAGLRQSPLSAPSLAVVGIAQQALGNQSAAKKAMDASLRLSRRDLITHFWFAEQYARQGRIGPALLHFDLALKTDYNAPTVMLPLLGQAIRDPGIADGVSELLRKRPVWLLSALDYLTSMSPHPVSLAEIMMKAGHLPSEDAYRGVENRLIERLVSAGELDMARTYFMTLKGAAAGNLADAGFSNGTISAIRGPLAWRGTENAIASGSFISRGKAWELQGSSASGEAGEIAERITFLPSGRYRVSASTRIDGNPDASVLGVLTCIGVARALPQPHFDLTPRSDEVTVPAGCRSQRLTIVLDAGRGPLGAQAVVSGFRMDLTE